MPQRNHHNIEVLVTVTHKTPDGQLVHQTTIAKNGHDDGTADSTTARSAELIERAADHVVNLLEQNANYRRHRGDA